MYSADELRILCREFADIRVELDIRPDIVGYVFKNPDLKNWKPEFSIDTGFSHSDKSTWQSVSKPILERWEIKS